MPKGICKIKVMMIVSILHLNTYNLFSQNLVTNWSFEDTIPCISNPDPADPISSPPWMAFCQSPDYSSQIYCGFNSISWGFQVPKTGIAVMGIDMYTTIVPDFLRETLGQQLSDTLIPGHKYCVSFYVSLAEASKLAIDRIGALFTSFQVDCNYIFNFSAIPQVENPAGNIISDTLNWTLISGDFIAQGNEQYISIGNFYNDANTQFLQVPWGSYDESYYYVDDISVIDCTVGLPEIPLVNLTTSPNPVSSGDILTISANDITQIVKIELVTVDGKLIYHKIPSELISNQINLNMLFNPGIYFLRVQTLNGICTHKIAVTN